jgi:hypothetical protein
MIIRRALHWYHDGTDLIHDNPAGTTLLKFQSGVFAFQQATTISTTGLLTLDSGAAINIEPVSGSAILLDGTISIDAGVVTGATSITSTAFLGTLDGVVGGNTPAAITGTTIDASTDFTIGTTVITDDSIVMTPSASDTVTIAAATNGVLDITTADAGGTVGHINITADGDITLTTSSAVGAKVAVAGTAGNKTLFIPTSDVVTTGSRAAMAGTQWIVSKLDQDATEVAYCQFAIPDDFASVQSPAIQYVYIREGGNATGVVRFNPVAVYGRATEAWNTTTETGTDFTSPNPNATNMIIVVDTDLALSGIAVGDYIACNIERIGGDGADTYEADINVVGINFNYVRAKL